MVRHTTGILCVAITAEHAYRLRLPYMVEQNQDARKTAFTVSVDLAEGVTTGVSAQERTATIRALGSPTSRDTDFIRPGHIFPLIAHKRGLQARVGHTEAGVALAELTGGYPAALLSEIVAADGSMARGATLTAFAQEHQIPVISIAEIKSYQEKLEPLPKVLSYPRYEFEWVDVQLKTGLWNLATYPSLKHREQVVMRFGAGDKTPLVRLHSECLKPMVTDTFSTCAITKVAVLALLKSSRHISCRMKGSILSMPICSWATQLIHAIGLKRFQSSRISVLPQFNC
jgi:3,4-dihydroxy 2-butanone 4-phosphate synthase/GTP cyclohydrolase II